ncbi:MAG: hypothetical protein LBK04_04290 [Clostridiales Family XIII bacterium]|nr:hypothetical protein [Clostridiales Family XIII bacterium]
MKNLSHAAGGSSIILPVLRGFSRSAKQDSEANNASGGESEANVASCGNIVLGIHNVVVWQKHFL